MSMGEMDKDEGQTKGGLKWWAIVLICLGAVAVLAVAAIVIVNCCNEYVLAVDMNGEQEITVEYKGEFRDPGASAYFYGTLLSKQPRSVEAEAEGKVDTSVLGTYEVTYRAVYTHKHLFGERTYTQSAVRKVHVVDTTAPEITLTADPDGYTLPGQTYVEEGFTAVDNYDGELTAQVQRTETPEKVVYRVTDSAGNTAEVTRTIVYNDPIAPELKLKGGDIIVVKGGTYQEPGYTAQDNCDGDITDKVVVSGQVDSSKVGSYTLEYTVTDSYGNTATATRKVTVKQYSVTTAPANPTGGVIYLTFDDGPSQHTARLLDVLDKYNVKATFFVVRGGNVLSRMAASGHTVAMHSASHNYKKIYASEEAYFADLQAIQETIYSYTGQWAMLLRFPGGSSNTVSKFNPGIMTRLTQEVEARGYRYFDWNVDSKDAGGAKTADEVYNNVIGGVSVRKTSVVLQHDIHGFSVDAVERIIQWGLANGYTFKAMTMDSPGCHHGVNN